MDEKLQTLLNNQVNNEHGAALIYTQLAYELDNLSFPGMRDWFYAQAAEEREHAQKIAQHLLDRGYRVELSDIPVPSIKAATPLDAFEAAFAHEQKVSEQIREIARAADAAGDLIPAPSLTGSWMNRLRKRLLLARLLTRSSWLATMALACCASTLAWHPATRNIYNEAVKI